ncbi:hypothetical protein [Nostoc sp. CALU 1950]|uniref:hypothetical protein n=1 Tax=Nostoc sp. CALU 1950 TaxID=3104321 RepID=UPI003EB81D97
MKYKVTGFEAGSRNSLQLYLSYLQTAVFNERIQAINRDLSISPKARSLQSALFR